MLKKFFSIIVMILITISWTMAQEIAVPDGYAGHAGTTGGGNATPITVSSASEFKTAIDNDNPAVIIVSGRLNLGGDVSVGSNKTIIGADTSAGLYAGSIKLKGTNYIIQNLILGRTPGDVMEVSGGTKAFIHKCSFHDSSDELLSIVRAADSVTVSWCKFYFDFPGSHSFAHLIGSSDSHYSDRGKLHVTMHHNWYSKGVVERMPRVRFGYVHIYNNYYNSLGNNYCIGTGKECHIRVENCLFDNVNQLWFDWGGVASGGVLGWDNLKLVNSTLPTYFSNSYPAFELSYQYDLDPVESVKDIVINGAGNVFGMTSVDETHHSIPNQFKLYPAYPNPFNPSTKIDFLCSKKSHVKLEVFDITGRRVATLIDEVKGAGNHSINFNGSNLSTGIYVYKLTTANNIYARKMLLSK